MKLLISDNCSPKTSLPSNINVERKQHPSHNRATSIEEIISARIVATSLEIK